MNNIQDKIIYYLKTYCFGKINAISKNELAAVFNISARELRSIKRKIVIERKIPIGATSRDGYYYASNDLETREFSNYSLSLAREHLDLKDAYDEIVDKKNQPSML